MKDTYETTSAEETRRVAHAVAEDVLRAPRRDGATVLTLSGDLGAGKTTFAQGVLEALGAQGPFTSPTFTIIKTYPLPDARTVYHVDPYRVGADDLEALGWEQMVSERGAIILLEWPQIVAALVPEDAVRVELSHVDERTRRIAITSAQERTIR